MVNVNIRRQKPLGAGCVEDMIVCGPKFATAEPDVIPKFDQLLNELNKQCTAERGQDQFVIKEKIKKIHEVRNFLLNHTNCNKQMFDVTIRSLPKAIPRRTT